MLWIQSEALVFSDSRRNAIEIIRRAIEDSLDGLKIGLEVELDEPPSSKFLAHVLYDACLACTTGSTNEQRVHIPTLKPGANSVLDLSLHVDGTLWHEFLRPQVHLSR